MQREHELAVQALVHAVLLDQHRQFRQQLTMAAQPQIGLDALVQRAQPRLLQPPDLHVDLMAGLDVGEHLAVPQRERVGQTARGSGVVLGVHGPVARPRAPLELAEVHGAAPALQAVAAGDGGEDVLGGAPLVLVVRQRLGDQLAQLQHVRLERGARTARRGLAPQLLDERGHGDHLVCVEREEGENLPRLERRGDDRHSVLAHRQRSQHFDVHVLPLESGFRTDASRPVTP